MWHVTIPMYKPIEQHERGQQNAVEEGQSIFITL